MRRVAFAFALILTLTACGGASDSSAGGGHGASREQLSKGGAGADQVGEGGEGGQDGRDGNAAKGGKGGLAAVQVGRATIRTGTMTVRVPDVPAAARAAIRAAEGTGGYLEEEHTDTETTQLTLRVPPEDFTATADAMGKLGAVSERTVSTDDVTGDVADVEGRLKAARASVDRVRGLLRRASTISEITSLESELNEREASLESLETRRRALAGKTTYASLKVTFTPPAVAAGPAEEKKIEDASFGSGLAAGWRVFKTTVTVLLVLLGALLPFLAVAAVVGVPLYLRRRRVTARA